jgi:hypothetical protein
LVFIPRYQDMILTSIFALMISRETPTCPASDQGMACLPRSDEWHQGRIKSTTDSSLRHQEPCCRWASRCWSNQEPCNGVHKLWIQDGPSLSQFSHQITWETLQLASYSAR